MEGDTALSLASDMLWTAMQVAGPLIAIAMVVGLLVSIVQVITQIQESSLSFVPKALAAAVTLLVLGGWMLATLTNYARRVIGAIPSYF
ncbi:MAG: flagellar biosynthetic protein FliQ [Gammaproteobacteria bacterium]|nr:flagellar biosynthetic protein FliQ [Gammaproteobacteria bacterium]